MLSQPTYHFTFFNFPIYFVTYPDYNLITFDNKPFLVLSLVSTSTFEVNFHNKNIPLHVNQSIVQFQQLLLNLGGNPQVGENNLVKPHPALLESVKMLRLIL